MDFLKEIVALAKTLDYDEISKILSKMTVPQRHKGISGRLKTGETGYRLIALADLMQIKGAEEEEIIYREFGAEALVIELISDERIDKNERMLAVREAIRNYELAADKVKKIKSEPLVFIYDYSRVITIEFDNNKVRSLYRKAKNLSRDFKVKKGVKRIEEKPVQVSKLQAQLLKVVEEFKPNKLKQLWKLYFERGKGIQYLLQKSNNRITKHIKKVFANGINLILNDEKKIEKIKYTFIKPESVTLAIIKAVREKLYKKRK